MVSKVVNIMKNSSGKPYKYCDSTQVLFLINRVITDPFKTVFNGAFA